MDIYLSSIDWKKLEHAYGSARDVPGLLKKLSSQNDAVLDKIWWKLYGNIYHQGTVFEATAYAVPYLIYLLQQDKTRKKHSILIYLNHLFHGTSYHDVHQSLFEDDAATEDYQNEIIKELEWVGNVKKAVIDGETLYRGFLNSSVEQERMAAIDLLASLAADDRSLLEELIQKCIQIDDSSEKALLLYLLGKYSSLDERILPLLYDGLNTASYPLTRFCSACCLAYIEKEHAPDAACTVLAKACVEADPEMDQEWQSMPFQPMKLIFNAIFFLSFMGKKAKEVIPYLLKSEILGWAGIEGYGNYLLSIVFDDKPCPQGKLFSDFDVYQKMVLKRFADVESLWFSEKCINDTVQRVNNGNTSRIIGEFAFPNTYDSFRNFVYKTMRNEESLNDQ